MPIDIAPDAIVAVTMTGAELNKAIADAVAVTMAGADYNKGVADAVAEALKALGFGARKAKPAAPKLAYTIKEAVSVTGLGRTSLYLAIRLGELRVVKKGARTIILDRDLRRWLEGGLPASNA
jgi:hypothetical protein